MPLDVDAKIKRLEEEAEEWRERKKWVDEFNKKFEVLLADFEKEHNVFLIGAHITHGEGLKPKDSERKIRFTFYF